MAGGAGAVGWNCTLIAVTNTTQQLQSLVPYFLQENTVIATEDIISEYKRGIIW